MRHLYLADGSINQRLVNNDIIIWGCGQNGRKLLSELVEMGCEVKFFCDSDEKNIGGTFENIPIIAPDELEKYRHYNLALAFFKWYEVVDIIPEFMLDNVFADYLFEHENIECECILCRSKNTTYDNAHFADFIKHRMFGGIEKKTQLIHCKECDLFFSQYRPNDDEMQRQYCCYRDKEYQVERQIFEKDYTPERNTTLGMEGKRKSRLNTYLQKWMSLDGIETVLDYGGDRGQIIPDIFNNSAKYVYEISGVETESGVTMLNTLEDVSKIKWDFIMCCHLLEHVSNPVSIIENMVNNLNDGAYFYLELPLEERIKYYSNVEINEHINFYSKQTMLKIGQLFGLKMVNVTEEGVVLRTLYQKTRGGKKC